MAAAVREIPFVGGLLRLRPQTEADEAFRFALFCASRPPGEDFSPLGEELAQQMLRQQFRAQNFSYRNDFPDARFDIVEFGAAPVGYVVVDLSALGARVVDLAIIPERRSGGLGEAVMRSIFADARIRALPVRASVFSGNEGSLRFCRRLGFAPVGESAAFHIELEWCGASLSCVRKSAT